MHTKHQACWLYVPILPVSDHSFVLFSYAAYSMVSSSNSQNHTYTHALMHTCIHTHERTHARTHPRTHARTHARTHTQVLVLAFTTARTGYVASIQGLSQEEATRLVVLLAAGTPALSPRTNLETHTHTHKHMYTCETHRHLLTHVIWLQTNLKDNPTAHRCYCTVHSSYLLYITVTAYQ